jgi:hypothetical protein
VHAIATQVLPGGAEKQAIHVVSNLFRVIWTCFGGVISVQRLPRRLFRPIAEVWPFQLRPPHMASHAEVRYSIVGGSKFPGTRTSRERKRWTCLYGTVD